MHHTRRKRVDKETERIIGLKNDEIGRLDRLVDCVSRAWLEDYLCWQGIMGKPTPDILRTWLRKWNEATAPHKEEE
jgi:hypothetical protein